jgi:hypothetical protein
MLMPVTGAGRTPFRKSHGHSLPKRRKGPRPRPRGAWSWITPVRTPGAATALTVSDREVRIEGALGPDDTDHFFQIRVGSGTALRLGLSTRSSAAGLQLIRLPDSPGGGAVHPADALAELSTLVTDPAVLELTPGAGSYLVRVYSFFKDADEYLLELSTRRAGPGDQGSGATPVTGGADLPSEWRA